MFMLEHNSQLCTSPWVPYWLDGPEISLKPVAENKKFTHAIFINIKSFIFKASL